MVYTGFGLVSFSRLIIGVYLCAFLVDLSRLEHHYSLMDAAGTINLDANKHIAQKFASSSSFDISDVSTSRPYSSIHPFANFSKTSPSQVPLQHLLHRRRILERLRSIHLVRGAMTCYAPIVEGSYEL